MFNSYTSILYIFCQLEMTSRFNLFFTFFKSDGIYVHNWVENETLDETYNSK